VHRRAGSVLVLLALVAGCGDRDAGKTSAPTDVIAGTAPTSLVTAAETTAAPTTTTTAAPPTTAAPTTTTAPPTPTTVPSQVDLGVPAPEAIKVQFPPVPRSTTKNTDAPPLGDTTAVGNTTGTRRPLNPVVPLSAEQCDALRRDKASIESDLAILNGVPEAAKTSTVKEKIGILQNALTVVNFRLQGC